MTETNRRIRELTESRAALERRLGELSEENDRLRAARDDLFAAHKDERDVRQRLDALVKEAKDIIGQAASTKHKIVPETIRRQAETWQQTAARLLGQGRS
jgi:uncharacterized coiled-coil DUF342 family protein